MAGVRFCYFSFRCSVFLIDKETDELVAKVFDGIQANDNENEVCHSIISVINPYLI